MSMRTCPLCEPPKASVVKALADAPRPEVGAVREVRFVVRERVDIKLRRAINEVAIQLLSATLVVQEELRLELRVLSEPRTEERGQPIDRRARQRGQCG